MIQGLAISAQILLGCALLLVLAAAVATPFILRRRSSRKGAELSKPRELLRAKASRVVRGGRAEHLRLSSGTWVHMSPSASLGEEELRDATGEVLRQARTSQLVQIGLDELLASDHPAGAAFYALAGVGPSELRPAAVRFTIAPALLRRELIRAFEEAGLKTSTVSGEGSGGAGTLLRLRAFGHEVPVSLAPLMAEAAATAAPIRTIGRLEASRVRAELSMLAAFEKETSEAFEDGEVKVEGDRLLLRWGTESKELDLRQAALFPWYAAAKNTTRGKSEEGGEETRDEPVESRVFRRLRGPRVLKEGRLAAIDRGGHVETFELELESGFEELGWDHPLVKQLGPEGLGDVADATPGASAFRGCAFSVPGRSGEREAWVFVGPHAASIAQHPRLLAGAAEAAGGPPKGSRVRAYAYREDVLVMAPSDAESSLLAACRKRVALLFEATSRPSTAPLLIDTHVSLGERAEGAFQMVRLDERFFEAAKGAERARLQGDPAGAATARAMTRLSLSDLTGARAHLEEAVRLGPENGEILLALGTLLNEIGDHEGAEEVLRRAVGLDLENPATNNNLGVAYQNLGRLAEAQLFFEKAASIRPEDAVTRVNLGRARLDSGDAAGAEDSFFDALSRDPRSVPALTGLVLVAVREGDYGLARDRLSTALGIAPGDAGLLRLHQALYPEEQSH